MDNSIRQCKKCSSYMNYHMSYNFGNPFSYYICPYCGYDTRKDDYSYTATNHTSITNQNAITTNSILIKE
jgi:hypothetical protein